MGPEIDIVKIEIVNDNSYQIDLVDSGDGKWIRTFIRRDALFALLTVAENENNKE